MRTRNISRAVQFTDGKPAALNYIYNFSSSRPDHQIYVAERCT